MGVCLHAITSDLLSVVCLLICGLLMSGCGAVGWFASSMPKSEDAKYKGLAKQRVAVMIWAERSTRIDYQTIQLDLGNTIQATLLAKADQDDVENIQFPYEVRSVIRFQKEHPELEGRSITEYAQRIAGITRMIYVEIGDFTHAQRHGRATHARGNHGEREGPGDQWRQVEGRL